MTVNLTKFALCVILSLYNTHVRQANLGLGLYSREQRDANLELRINYEIKGRNNSHFPFIDLIYKADEEKKIGQMIKGCLEPHFLSSVWFPRAETPEVGFADGNDEEKRALTQEEGEEEGGGGGGVPMLLSSFIICRLCQLSRMDDFGLGKKSPPHKYFAFEVVRFGLNKIK